MDLWVIWIVVACLFAAGEIMSLSFYLAPFAAGAAVAAIVDVAGAPDAVSVAAFLVASLAALMLLRPVARRHRLTPPSYRSNAQALIGQTVIVQEEIDNDRETGTVKLSGEIWTARSYVDGHKIPAGSRVDVVEIKGATALVTE